MDSRLDVEKVLGLDLGDAHVIRNGNILQYLNIWCKADMVVIAGGRAVEALRSILISQQLLGTREIIIMHHVRQSNPSPRDRQNVVWDHRTISSSLTGPADTPHADRLWHAELL
jgi:hypothetical protein